MNILKKIWGISLLAFLLIAIAPNKVKAQDITEQDFYDNLSQYGTWVTDPQYGDVWVPDAGDDFRPYATNGHWVLTDYGNTWVSDYPWGWATFHYGRWHYDDYYGWEWVPGYEWAPAWVSWRQGGGYYGWAPLMPGISLSISFGGGYNVPDRYWVCAPQAYINRPNIYNYYVPHARVVTIIHNTTIINNTYVHDNRKYIAGPRAEDIQRYTHQRPQVYHINNATAPGAINVRNNAVTIFRPAVKKVPEAHPQRVVDGAAYRQQNPNQGIAQRGPAGAAAVNHANASRLAAVARSSTPDNKVVRVNNRPNAPQAGAAPNQEGNRPAVGQQHNRPGQPGGVPQPNAPAGQPAVNNPNEQHNHAGQRGVQGQPNTPAVNANPAQQPKPANVNGQHIGGERVHGGRPEDRPNVTPANPAAQPAQQQAQQQLLQQQRQQRDAQQQQAKQQDQQAQQQAQQQQRQQQQAQQQAQQQQRQQQQAQQQAQQQQRQQQQAQQQAQQQQRQQQQAQQQAQQQQRQQQQAQQQAQQQQRQQQQAQQQAQQQQRQQQQAQQQQRQQQQAQQQAQRQQQAQQRQQRPVQPPKPPDHHPDHPVQ